MWTDEWILCLSELEVEGGGGNAHFVRLQKQSMCAAFIPSVYKQEPCLWAVGACVKLQTQVGLQRELKFILKIFLFFPEEP